MESFAFEMTQTLRDFALAYPEVSEGASCVNRAFKARKKNFVFLGEKPNLIRVMVKLGPSLDEANALAETDDTLSVGTAGWTTLLFAPDQGPPVERLQRWIDESYRLLAPKTLVRALDARDV